MLGKLQIIFRALLIRIIGLGKRCRLSMTADIYVHRGAVLQIGRGVRLGKGCVISVLPGARLIIGDGCIINNGSFIYAQDRIELGPNTRVAHYCSIIDHDYDFREGQGLNETAKRAAPIIIGAGVWLGAYVMVLKGVSIGNGAVVGAKALVRKPIPARSIAYCRQCSELTIKNID